MEALVPAINGFSIGGIRIRIARSWFTGFLLFAWMFSSRYFPRFLPDYPAFSYWFAGTVASLAFFACFLLHELSHCLVARRLGTPVRQIKLIITGAVSEMAQNHSNSPMTEFLTTIAGPLSSLFLGLLFAAVVAVLKSGLDRLSFEMLRFLIYVNILLAAYSLIPGLPLDGGRVLRSYLWYRSGNLPQATKSASRVGKIFAMMLMVLGLMFLLAMHIAPGVWLILIGVFLKRSAESEFRSAELRLGLQDMKITEIMAPAIAVDSSTTISKFVNDYVFHYHYRVFPVVELGRFVGMIDVRSIKAVSPNDWPTSKIGAFLSDPSTYCVLDPEMDAINALRLLMTPNCSKAPIVRKGTLMGFLTRSDLLKLVSLKRDIAA
jgi:Zn-dependent protease/predicted transcriptional regulator